MAMVKNKTIKEAKEDLDKLTADPKMRGIIKLRDKWERDYYNGIACAKDEGLEQGLEQGTNDTMERIAINSFKMGNTIEQTSMLTGLSKEKLQKIKHKMKC